MSRMKKVLVLIFILAVVFMDFINQYYSRIETFGAAAASKEALITKYVELGTNFMDMMTIYGEDFFKRPDIQDSTLLSLLKYNPGSDTYDLEAAGGTDHQKNAGNLTGSGKVPESGINRKEINLALAYNQFFKDFYGKYPEIAWLYYTSENDFTNIYPWVSSKDFAFRKELKQAEFYTYVNPQNNPQRLALWTPAYLDRAGKGTMVTLSSPIYDQDVFKGVLSLDLTTMGLSRIINSGYEGYLLDQENSIIAKNQNAKNQSDLNKFQDNEEITPLFVLPNNPQGDIQKLKEIKDGSVERIGNDYIYKMSITDSPWTMIFRVPVSSIVMESALYTFPILIIGILLFLTINEIEKRIKTGKQLAQSLEELTAYHQILENAANYDFLTKTFNRRGFKDYFSLIQDQNGITLTPITLILGDIDHFKGFNDTFGHFAGDKVLIEIADILKNTSLRMKRFVAGAEKNSCLCCATELARKYCK